MTRTFLTRLAENVVVTYLYSVITFLTLNTSGAIDLALWKTALVAGIPAVLSAVKGLLASQVSNPDSPAFTE